MEAGWKSLLSKMFLVEMNLMISFLLPDRRMSSKD